MKWPSWDGPALARFKRAYARALSDKQDRFVFDGDTYLADYAKYLIEYLEDRIKVPEGADRPMNKSRYGFTLVELMIVVIILGIIGAAVMSTGCQSCTASTVQSNAQKYGRHYARVFLHIQQPQVECAGTDSDHNGYVSCNVTENAPGAAVRQIECPANYMLENNVNCRAYGLRTLDVNGQQIQQVPSN